VKQIQKSKFNVEGRKALVLAGDLRAQFVPKLIGNLEKDLDNGRVELGSGAAQNLFARHVEAARLAVGPVAGNRVQRVGDGKDAGADRNLVPAQPVRVAAAVVVLLVRKTISAASERNGILRSM
jgi:hypothetical protein